MIIPWQSLAPETRRNILETFALREGTDYGENELSLKDKVSQLEVQLEKGEIVIVWSELHESLSIKNHRELS